MIVDVIYRLAEQRPPSASCSVFADHDSRCSRPLGGVVVQPTRRREKSGRRFDDHVGAFAEDCSARIGDTQRHAAPCWREDDRPQSDSACRGEAGPCSELPDGLRKSRLAVDRPSHSLGRAGECIQPAFASLASRCYLEGRRPSPSAQLVPAAAERAGLPSEASLAGWKLEQCWPSADFFGGGSLAAAFLREGALGLESFLVASVGGGAGNVEGRARLGGVGGGRRSSWRGSGRAGSGGSAAISDGFVG